MSKSIKPNSKFDIKPQNKPDSKQNQLNVTLILRRAFSDMIHHKVAPILGWITANVLLIIIGIYVVKSPLVTIIFILALWVFTFSYFVFKQSIPRKQKLFIYLILSIFVITACIYFFVYKKTSENIPIVKTKELPKTLFDSYEKAFDNLSTINITDKVLFYNNSTTNDSFSMKYNATILLNYPENTYFFKFYIYDTDKIMIRTSIFCLDLPEICDSIRYSPRYIHALVNSPAHIKSLDDLSFSKKICVYHETKLSSTIIGQLTDSLNNKNIFPEFRGPDYLFLEQHKNDCTSTHIKMQ